MGSPVLSMRAMLLAAGRGERMGALTAHRPKPLLELGAESLIERHLRRLAAAGIENVVVNLSYHGEQIRARLGNGARYSVSIRYSSEGEPPLETGGGVVHALPLLGSGPFLLINADVYTNFDFAKLTRRESRPTLVLVPNPPHHAQGDFGLDADGHVTADPPLWTFAGISRLDTAMFEQLAPGARPLKPVLDTALAHRDLLGLLYEGTWIDVGTPERLQQAIDTNR